MGREEEEGWGGQPILTGEGASRGRGSRAARGVQQARPGLGLRLARSGGGMVSLGGGDPGAAVPLAPGGSGFGEDQSTRLVGRGSSAAGTEGGPWEAGDLPLPTLTPADLPGPAMSPRSSAELQG